MAFTGDARVDVEKLSTKQLEDLISNDDAFKNFLGDWLQSTPGARTLAEVQQQNANLAQENVEMQRAIDEAKNHVAIVKSSDYAAAKAVFDELRQRQDAVFSKLGSNVLMQRLVQEVDKLDVESDEVLDACTSGSLTMEQFVEQYLQRRMAYHSADLKRQVAVHSQPFAF